MIGMNWEVGSTWYCADKYEDLQEQKDVSTNLNFSHITEDKISFLSTCRSAIALAIQGICGANKVLVPSFTCHSVLWPVINSGCEVKGYPLKKNLEIDIAGLSALVEDFQPDAILVHGYFGFDTLNSAKEYLDSLRKKGIKIIEDTTQTMFSTYKHVNADYYVGSIRKWFPIPDGAFLSGIDLDRELSEDTELSAAKLRAMSAKHDYICTDRGVKEAFMPLFSKAEAILDSREIPYTISRASQEFINQHDLTQYAKIRRDNFNRLAARLVEHPELSVIFPTAPDDTVPFLLPVYVRENRGEFQHYMAQHNVFPTVIWACPDEIKSGLKSCPKEIYDEILCFHVDQRYDLSDMDKVADIVDTYFHHN